MTAEEATAKAESLQAFRALEKNPAWIGEIMPKIAGFYKEATDGVRARSKTPEQRAEWVEAAHFAEDFQGFVQDRIDGLIKELRAYTQEQTGVSEDVLNSLG